ncbi:MAG: nicotinamide-nucleotide amidase [Chromatiales bacterium]|jgi:nicotinamide-nucleotide amidase
MRVSIDQQNILQLGALLSAQNWRLATAESCTGGWVAKCCTDVSGSSAWFDRGFVTYSNQSKTDMLGVPAATIASHGAVSREVVHAMADGCRQAAGVELAVAISGIAGPGGGTPDKPVGTVWFGFAMQGLETMARQQHFSGDRDAVRRQAVNHAFVVLNELMQKI